MEMLNLSTGTSKLYFHTVLESLYLHISNFYLTFLFFGKQSLSTTLPSAFDARSTAMRNFDQ